MLHRIVSRSVGVVSFAALSLGIAACEDNTTGTPLPPPTPTAAVTVNAVVPDSGYVIDTATIARPNGPDTTFSAPDTVIVGIDTTITVDTTVVTDTTVAFVSPNVVFHVLLADGTPAVGQEVQFSTTLNGIVENRSATVDANGNVSPGLWIVSCRTQDQRVIATPAVGQTGVVDVNVTGVPPQFCPFEQEPPAPPPPEEPEAH